MTPATLLAWQRRYPDSVDNLSLGAELAFRSDRHGGGQVEGKKSPRRARSS